MSNYKSNYPPAAEPSDPPEVITRMIEEAMALAEWSPIDKTDAKAIAERCQRYFDFCAERSKRPIVHGLCLSMGITRPTLIKWEKENTERGEVIRRAKGVIRALIEEWSVTGKVSPPIGIFWAKNLLDMSDRKDITISMADTDAPRPEMTAEEIQKKLLEDLPIDSEYKEVQ